MGGEVFLASAVMGIAGQVRRLAWVVFRLGAARRRLCLNLLSPCTGIEAKLSVFHAALLHHAGKPRAAAAGLVGERVSHSYL